MRGSTPVGTLSGMECAEALSQLGGMAPYSLLTQMTSRRKLRTALGRGDVVRVARDRYALPVADRGKRLAIRLDAHLSHLSAALRYGWEMCSAPAEPRLIVPSGRPLPRGERARIQVFDARPDQLDGWATSAVTTVLMCARDLAQRDALAIADSALRHRSVTAADLDAAVSAWPEHVRGIVAHATGAAANPLESALRSIALDLGLELIAQYEVRVGGDVFHPDLVDPIRGVVVEADSWSWHADKEAHERDCRRYTLLTADGWLVLRFTYDQVMHRPDFVRACLRRVYAEARGHRFSDPPVDTTLAPRVDRHVA